MKKLFAVLLVFTAFCFCFSVTSYADDSYYEGFKIIGGKQLEEELDRNTRDFFQKNGINPEDYNWVNNLSSKDFLASIWNVVKDGLKTPIKSGALILSVILIQSAFLSFGFNNSVFDYAKIVVSVSVALAVSKNIWECVWTATETVRYISSFMIAFIPVFIAAVVMSGGIVSGTVSSGLLMLLAQVISDFSSKFILPVMGGYMSINVLSSLTDFPLIKNLSNSFKKVALWAIGLVSTVFVGILGIQTTVNSAADSLTLKTAKFIVGTCVPVAGGTLAEATNTVYASFGLLKSSVGIYGVFVLGIMILPVVVQIVLWKGILCILSGVSVSFSQDSLGKFLESVNALLSVVITILLSCAGLFVISLSILITVGKAV